jgi:tetratricopeptide (TPR) repeat protein
MAGVADKAKILEQAQKHLQKGNVEKAIRSFQELLEIDPRDRRIRLRFADLLAKAGKRKEAVEHYEKVATTYIKDDFVPQAIAVFKTITRLDPERIDLLEKLADLYKSQGLEGEAVTQLQGIYEAYSRTGNEEGQVRALRRMVEIDSENLGVQVRLGETLAKMGQKQEAAEAFARAATTLSRRGFHDRASALFERIINLNPRNVSVRKELCAHYLEAGKFEEARREVTAILEFDPEDARMVLLLGRILFRLGERAEAEKAIARSLDLFASGGELEKVVREYLFVAQTHLKLGDLDEAETFYREVRRATWGDLESLKGLAAVAAARGDEGERLRLLGELAAAQAAKGERKNARETYEKVLEADPSNADARAFLSQPADHGDAEELSVPAHQDMAVFGEETPAGEAIGASDAAGGEIVLEEIEGLGDIESLLPREGGEGGANWDDATLELDLLEEGAPSSPAQGEGAPAGGGMPELVFDEPEEDPAGPDFSPPAASPPTGPGSGLPNPPPAAPAAAPPPPPRAHPPAAPPAGASKLAGSTDELLVEADLYSRYGLWDKAIDIYQGLLARDPRELRALEALYRAQRETGATDAPATARRLVMGLREAGRQEQAAEAFATLTADFPSSPEAAGLAPVFSSPPAPAAAPAAPPAQKPAPAPGRPAAPAPSTPAPSTPSAPPGPDPFLEEFEEAEFYVTQGLAEEAARIYRGILTRAPGHAIAAARLRELTADDGGGPAAAPPPPLTPPSPRELPQQARQEPTRAGGLRSKLTVESDAPATDDFLDIAEELRAELAEEMEEKKPAPPEEGHVTFEEIFAEFKKGIAATLGEQEYETHYNLGIAYKDMGLIDDSIRELQIASRDPKLFHDSLSLMAMCFLDRGDLKSARGSIQTALTRAPEGHRTGLTFQLGQIQEKERDFDGALESYSEVQRRDPKFEGIAASVERVSSVLKQGRKKAEQEKDDDQFENLFADLIREVGDLAEENRREGAAGKGDVPAGDGPDRPPPGPGKKQRISYL